MALSWETLAKDIVFNKKTWLALGVASFAGSALYVAYRLHEIAKRQRMLREAPEKRVLVLGLDGAGKSSLLQHMNSGDSASALQPTNGFSVISIQNEGVALNIWEVGGAEGVRSYWENFLQGTELLIFVVDSIDEDRFTVAKEELTKLLADQRLKGVPLVVVANKQDQAGAKQGSEICKALGVEPDCDDRDVYIIETHTSENSASLEEIERLKNMMRTLWPKD
ncbi:ADP-ribosylation factor-like protein 3 [Apostichopus japonicus]|uniref:ADP-ribosylation factor-like protein 3 n=1 Tax=Stichopus japonicus TaxID=307972 RepID=UPI003AB6CC05